MALANGSDGLWFSKNSNTTVAFRQFTRTMNISANSNPTVIQITQGTNTPGSYRTMVAWGRVFMERNDGTANWASMNQVKGVMVWAVDTWSNRYSDSYGGSHINTTVYPHIDTSGNQVQFKCHVFGAPGWGQTVVYSVLIAYDAWNLVTVTYP